MSTSGQLRVLFRLWVTREFYAAPADEQTRVIEALPPAFDRLGERFGITVLGTLDEDLLQVGTGAREPVSYVLADAPDLTAVQAVCGIVRTERVDGFPLWRYLEIDARIGHDLFFATH
ncbi:hypothetical protein [Amycolatopsis sp. BJA-103]|uniref:hypothetical protein n=1 Tax=unclassified Amycolatopsis TaxID=2618356 RepID=UPI000C784A29|nr:hypothetical protein [Amycolatopsis sp. BJA-103]AUI59525.1 hypothetical protein BKN51_15680 [Amycolatopsis sp. BJA-103]PNE17031.1 hypothetical protein B1H26_18850 [Amycolatopsis sp. BJA-103]